MELGFCTYGQIHLLGPSDPYVVSLPQTPRLKKFWNFIMLLDLSCNSWKNEVLFVKIGTRVLQIWHDMSFEPKYTKCSFWVPGTKVNKVFSDFIILYDSSYNSGKKMRSCLWKWKLGLIYVFWTCSSDPIVANEI